MMEQEIYDQMYELEQHFWWFTAKRRIISHLLKKFLPKNSGKKVCDIGCGCGMTMVELQEQGYDISGIDFSDTALGYCRQRNMTVFKGDIIKGLELKDGCFDAALMLDVAEHLDDDTAGITEALRLVKPGGILIITVPAYSWLWTKRDALHHHKRRYNMSQFKKIIAPLDVKIVRLSYANSLLFPLALAERLFHKCLPFLQRDADIIIPPLGSNELLCEIFALEKHILSAGIPMFAGLSILTILQKK
ncbi:MAG: class I SAM-dependent methyltransferase [Phycisphaerae bacterium]|nr:class I SAM-dependent methyltransferase [Phycisphaerae bacterium]